MNKAQKKFAVGAAILVAAIGYLIFTGVQASGTYYYTVAEALAMGPRSSLRLEGKVAPGTIQADTASLTLKFNITDASQASLPVVYKGVTPDMFQENLDVVVEGALDQSGQFTATRLLTSCPSKYEAAGQATKAN